MSAKEPSEAKAKRAIGALDGVDEAMDALDKVKNGLESIQRIARREYRARSVVAIAVLVLVWSYSREWVHTVEQATAEIRPIETPMVQPKGNKILRSHVVGVRLATTNNLIIQNTRFLDETTEQPFDVRWVDQDGKVVAELLDVTEITAPGFRGFSMWPPRSNGVAIIRVKRAPGLRD